MKPIKTSAFLSHCLGRMVCSRALSKKASRQAVYGVSGGIIPHLSGKVNENIGQRE